MKLSISGWWKCCQCFLAVNPAVNGNDCPDFDCSHHRCSCCGVYGDAAGTRTTSPRTVAMESKNSDILHHEEEFKGDHAAKAANPKGFKPVPGSEVPSSRPRASPKQLELYLDSKLVPNACADSGSTVNCMSLGLAQRLRIPFNHHIRIFNLPVKGAVIESIGLASITCHFPKEPSKPKYLEDKIDFFIFRSLPRELIVGNPFLRGTGILDKFFWRLIDAETEQSGFVKINPVGNTKESVQCWLEGKPLQSLADTGAEMNLISTEYAHASGFAFHEYSTDDRESKEQRMCFELADLSRILPRGHVELKIAFCPPAECGTSIHRLEASKASSRKTTLTFENMDDSSSKHNCRIIERFYVVDDLIYDIILCETLLFTIEAYTKHSHRFSTSEDQKTSCIAVGRTKKAGEGSKQPRTRRSEEYIFKDNLTNEIDRYEKEIEEVENFFNLGSIGADERQASKTRAEQAHLQWLRDHHELLERYWPGYYEKHVPQEVS